MDKSSLPNSDKMGLCGRGTEGGLYPFTRTPGNWLVSFRKTARRETEPRLMPGLFGIPIPLKSRDNHYSRTAKEEVRLYPNKVNEECLYSVMGGKGKQLLMKSTI